MFPCGYCANATVLHAGSVTRLTHHSLYLVLHITQELLGPESDLLMQAGINPPLEVILYPSWLYIQGSYMLSRATKRNNSCLFYRSGCGCVVFSKKFHVLFASKLLAMQVSHYARMNNTFKIGQPLLFL